MNCVTEQTCFLQISFIRMPLGLMTSAACPTPLAYILYPTTCFCALVSKTALHVLSPLCLSYVWTALHVPTPLIACIENLGEYLVSKEALDVPTPLDFLHQKNSAAYPMPLAYVFCPKQLQGP